MCVFQAEDGIRYLVRSRGLGDVYKRQVLARRHVVRAVDQRGFDQRGQGIGDAAHADDPLAVSYTHLTLPTSDLSVDLGGRRIIKKKKTIAIRSSQDLA